MLESIIIRQRVAIHRGSLVPEIENGDGFVGCVGLPDAHVILQACDLERVVTRFLRPRVWQDGQSTSESAQTVVLTALHRGHRVVLLVDGHGPRSHGVGRRLLHL